MKRFLIPLLTAAVIVSIVLAGCVPAPAPPTPAPPAPAPPSALCPWGGDFAVKPDGTPYFVGFAIVWLGDEWCQSAVGVGTSLLERAGAEVVSFDPNLDEAAQIGFLEDLMALTPPDALILHPVSEAALNPFAEWYEDAGIPVFNFDLILPSEEVTCRVSHKFKDPDIGTGLAGGFFVEKAEELGKPLKVYFIWGIRGWEMCQDRFRGFTAITAQHPDLITVVESADSEWSPEIMAELVEDAFTADPELNAIFIMGGMPTGVVSALRAVGRLYPVGDPEHVIVLSHDLNPAAESAMTEGDIDATLDHMSWDLVQLIDNFLFYNVVLGQPVPQLYYEPMVVVTTENKDTLQIYGVNVNYTLYPWPEWDEWPVMDFSELGYPPPTKDMRMQYQGY